MSSSLYWNPIKPQSGKSLSTSLKWTLKKRYESPLNIALDENDIPYLQGLADADVEDAQDLIDAIEIYDRIQLKEIF